MPLNAATRVSSSMEAHLKQNFTTTSAVIDGDG
jgi:hypothetical protein